MPRSSISVWPGPSLFSETLGVAAASTEKSTMPRASSSSAPMALMLIGVCCTVELRFCAVMISSDRGAASVTAVAVSSARAKDKERAVLPR